MRAHRQGMTALVAALLAAAGTSMARGPFADRPILVEASVCALPGAACPDPDEVLRLVVRGKETRTRVTDLVVLDGSMTSGTMLAELRLRPARLIGPDEVLEKLTPGTPLRLRAVVRLGARHLFVESLSPVGGD
jgi:hypothetical protein